MTRARSLSKLANSSIFTVDGDNNVGLNSTSPDAKLDVVGVISATSFFGSGSGLTGVASTDNIITGTAATFNNVVKVGTAITLDATSGIVTATQFSGNATGLTGSPSITVTNINAADITASGTLTYEDVTNIDSVGIITARKNIELPDSTGATVGRILFGAGDDLQIYHDGTDNFIKSNNALKIQAAGSNSYTVHISARTDKETIKCYNNTNAPYVELFYDNSKKLETTSSGVTVTGTVAATSYTGDGSSLTGISAGITTTKYSPTANAIIQIGLGTAQHHELTLSAGFTTITTSGGSFGDSHSLVLIQPSSGICTVGLSTFFQFPSGATPVFSEGSSKVDLVSFVVKDIAGNTGTGATELLASAGLNYS